MHCASSIRLSANKTPRVSYTRHTTPSKYNFRTTNSLTTNNSSNLTLKTQRPFSSKSGTAFDQSEIENQVAHPNLLRYIDAHRRYGHTVAQLDPLGRSRKADSSFELDQFQYGFDAYSASEEFPVKGIVNIEGNHVPFSQIEERVKQAYTDKIAGEFSFLDEAVERKWLADQLEALPTQKFSKEEKAKFWKQMAEAETFDHFMQKKFPVVKRYAMEGVEAVVPALNTVFEIAVNRGVTDIVMNMAHRGRLNLLVGLLKYPPRNMFWKVQGKNEFLDSEGKWAIGDVLSHLGQSVDLEYNGHKLHVTMIQNPSHLEASDPVALGKTRAKQDRFKQDPKKKVMCVMLHGDAAFYGQGVVSESFGLSYLDDFSTGGTIHIITNNQLGFTTTGETHGRSSKYSSDVGKITNTPVIHVNADHPEEVIKAAKVVAEYRAEFNRDIILDLIAYRRHGHNELDEPAFTQPTMYSAIRSHNSVIQLYGNQLASEGVLSEAEMKDYISQVDKMYDSEFKQASAPKAPQGEGYWKGFKIPDDITKVPVTGVALDALKSIAAKSVEYPADFKVHSRLQRGFCKARTDSVAENKLDWPTAEALAFGSLLQEGHPVRISGQDVGRGTFSHRHIELHDQETGKVYVPLNHMGVNAKIRPVNSPLSEFAVMGFEYGYSAEDPNTLTIWEAQFGDFANGAQLIIDTFIANAEAKWFKQSALTLLLPHGYDGAGPEHSSGRVERFLQLVDTDGLDVRHPRNKNPNMQVANITTPANYFHALRRQIVGRDFRKPLVIMTPKTLLRHPVAVSKIEEMGPGTKFAPLIGETDANINPANVTRVMFVSGKLYYDLVTERQKKNATNTAIIRVEELCPFPVEAIEAELAKYKSASNFIWAQEENQNAGAWWYIYPRLSQLLPSGKNLQYIGRPPCPASATGTSVLHKKEHEQLFSKLF